jgi:hypothetical protein
MHFRKQMSFLYTGDIKLQIILTKKYEDGAISIFVSGQGRCTMLTVPSSLPKLISRTFFKFFFYFRVLYKTMNLTSHLIQIVLSYLIKEFVIINFIFKLQSVERCSNLLFLASYYKDTSCSVFCHFDPISVVWM